MSGQKFTGIAGLPLSRRAVSVLKDRGIFAHSLVSIEHQQLAQRYVVRAWSQGAPQAMSVGMSALLETRESRWSFCIRWRRSE